MAIKLHLQTSLYKESNINKLEQKNNLFTPHSKTEII